MPQRLVQRSVKAAGKGVRSAAGVAAAFCVGAAVSKAITRSREQRHQVQKAWGEGHPEGSIPTTPTQWFQPWRTHL